MACVGGGGGVYANDPKSLRRPHSEVKIGTLPSLHRSSLSVSLRGEQSHIWRSMSLLPEARRREGARMCWAASALERW